MLNMAKLIPFILGTMFLSSSMAGASSLPERNDIPTQYKWHLEDIYTSEADWQKDFDALKAAFPKMQTYQGKLGQSPESLLHCLKLRDEIGILAGKLYGYARMHKDGDARDSHYQDLTGRTESLLSQAGAATAFIEPEILEISDQTLNEFMNKEPGLKTYAFSFKNLIRQKKHVLSPAEEVLLARASEVTQSPKNIFTMLARADMKFPDIKDASGNLTTLSEGRYNGLITSTDRAVREAAFKGLFETYYSYRNTLAATLGSNIKQTLFYSQARKHDSALEGALEADNVPVQVYDNLIDTVHTHLEPLHRYVALKKKVLKLNEMHMYDLYVPIVKNAELKYKYEEALQLVKDSLKPLGEQYNADLNKGLTSGWLDVYENKGKQSGAYSWGVYGVHPFVLLNYSGRLTDVSTIAHEMGHAMHSYYSSTYQDFSNHQYTIFCAEVASTTNEALLLQHLLKLTTDKTEKMFLLNQYLENVRTTVYRQTMFAEFEKITHAKAEAGETLTADTLESIWHELNVKYYGPNIVVDKEIDIEWARIPHFYSDFYVYQYVTGFSAATAFADKLLHEGNPAQEKYLGFLKSGGSDYSLTILKNAGVDMSKPEPIEITLKKFAATLDELEKLLDEG